MPSWPDKHPFALALSHDVDRVNKRAQFLYGIYAAIRYRKFSRLRAEIESFTALMNGHDPYWTFDNLMELEESLGVRSTFFFLNETGKVNILHPKTMVLFWGRYAILSPKIQEVIRKLDQGGWEIGLHGSYHSYNRLDLLFKEKKILESILKKPIAGARQHYLRVSVPETWQIHAQLGLRYDSSVGFSQKIGNPGNHHHPFFPENPVDGKPVPILEIPITIMDGPLMENYSDPWKEVMKVIAEVEEANGVITLNWHQQVFNPWEADNRREIYERVIKYCQQKGAWITPLCGVADWWLKNQFV